MLPKFFFLIFFLRQIFPKKNFLEKNFPMKTFPKKEFSKKKFLGKKFPEKKNLKKKSEKILERRGPKDPTVCSRRLQSSAGSRKRPPVGRQFFQYTLKVPLLRTRVILILLFVFIRLVVSSSHVVVFTYQESELVSSRIFFTILKIVLR